MINKHVDSATYEHLAGNLYVRLFVVICGYMLLKDTHIEPRKRAKRLYELLMFALCRLKPYLSCIISDGTATGKLIKFVSIFHPPCTSLDLY